jgi:hypothetical protein
MTSGIQVSWWFHPDESYGQMEELRQLRRPKYRAEGKPRQQPEGTGNPGVWQNSHPEGNSHREVSVKGWLGVRSQSAGKGAWNAGRGIPEGGLKQSRINE